MEMDNNNPFKAPEARVADIAPDSGEFLPEGRRVPAGNGVSWLGSGWTLFKMAPGAWIGLTIVFIVLMLVAGVIPILGGIAINLLLPVFIGGIMLGCKALDDGEELQIGHLFAGFSGYTSNLVLIGLIYMVGMFAIMLVMMLLAGAGVGIGALMGGDWSMALVPMILLFLVGFALMVPLAMALWFAPALVIFHEVQAFEAMKTSFFVCLKNFVPFLVYGLVYIVLAILASIPFFLGWLVLVPVMMASMYAGYRDMFIGD